jgi:hypothetical protein
MWTWLESDLAETEQDWRIAVMHHPPYARGDVDSDDPAQAEGRMAAMREQALPRLESGGVDLVIAGFSRSYQRSALLDGHYGGSTTLLPAMVLDAGTGSGGSEGIYRKDAGSPAHDGAVYAVAGSGSVAAAGPFDHPALVVGRAEVGALAIDIEGTRLEGRFIRSDGRSTDRFTLAKGAQTDADADGVDDAADNCPWLPNPAQQDGWNVGEPGSDGVGDACQCGDLDGGGALSQADLQTIRAHIAGSAVTPGEVASCDVEPPRGVCDLRDLVRLRRALAQVTCPPTQCALAGRLDPYGGLSPYAGDEHMHAALAGDWRLIADPLYDPNVSCAHQHKLPTEVYDACRANGLDFCAISHHSNTIDSWLGVAWWTDPANPDLLGIGTDPNGFPLPGGGHTPSELEHLQAWARQRNDPGSFVALYGIEYTVNPPTGSTCPSLGARAPRCGGHKVAICPHTGVTRRCAPADPDCDSEADFYRYLRDFDCAGSAAHPSGAIPQDFNPLDETGDGYDAEAVMGYELSPNVEFSAQLAAGAPTGWNGVLQAGLRLGVVFGSDTHNGPTLCGPFSNAPPGTHQRRMVCWADSLTRSGIVGAMRARRCYHVEAAAKPTVRFSIEDRPMGSVLRADELLDPASVRVRVATAGQGLFPSQSFDRFQLIHDGVAVLDQPCAASSVCTLDTALPVGDPRGYWYLRLLHGTATLMSATSPIWIE